LLISVGVWPHVEPKSVAVVSRQKSMYKPKRAPSEGQALNVFPRQALYSDDAIEHRKSKVRELVEEICRAALKLIEKRAKKTIREV
jgi:hypothetical protein